MENRDTVLSQLREQGISAKIHYPIPVHLQPAAAHLGYSKGDFPRAEAYAEQALTLPLNPYLREEEIEKVIEALRQVATEVARPAESIAG